MFDRVSEGTAGKGCSIVMSNPQFRSFEIRREENVPQHWSAQKSHQRPHRMNGPDHDPNHTTAPGGAEMDLDLPEHRLTANSARPLRAVIVEDEAIISMELAMILEDLGVVVMGTAMDAVQAEALVTLHRPDFMTMDINIKGNRDGISAAQSIFATHGVRSIFISAFGDAETKSRALGAKAFAWITKPIDERELADVVALVPRKSD